MQNLVMIKILFHRSFTGFYRKSRIALMRQKFKPLMTLKDLKL